MKRFLRQLGHRPKPENPSPNPRESEAQPEEDDLVDEFADEDLIGGVEEAPPEW
jgi:hypothetical protein